MIFETNGLKGMCFQAVETKPFQHRVKMMMSACHNLHRLTTSATHGHPGEGTSSNGLASAACAV